MFGPATHSSPISSGPQSPPSSLVEEDAGRAGFGHPEPLHDRDTAFEPVLQDCQRARRPADTGNPQARQVGVFEVGVLHHELIRRRNGEEMGDALGRVAQYPQRLTRIERLEDHHGAPRMQDRVAVAVQPAGVEQR
jgi:hypothetical protein